MRARHAIVREVPSSFADATVAVPHGRIDVARAREEHRAYVDALRAAGLDVTVLPADDAFPDCPFVEDTVLVAGGIALVARMGNPSRRGEEVAVRDALRAAGLRIEETPPPATFDGGDCLRVGRRVFVGRSGRTNDAGVARIAEVFGPLGLEVVAVPVSGELHLQSVCTALGDDRLLLAEGTVSAAAFDGIGVVPVPAHERPAANALDLGGVVLVAEGFPETRRRVEAAGLRVLALDNAEIRRADAAFTCLSVRW